MIALEANEIALWRGGAWTVRKKCRACQKDIELRMTTFGKWIAFREGPAVLRQIVDDRLLTFDVVSRSDRHNVGCAGRRQPHETKSEGVDGQRT